MRMPWLGVARGRIVGRKNHFMRAQGVTEARQRHFFIAFERVEERFKLRLVRMIGNIA